jgi:hypothetical protein
MLCEQQYRTIFDGTLLSGRKMPEFAMDSADVRIMNRLYRAPGVLDIRSNIVLKSIKDTGGVPASLLRSRVR